MDAFLNANNWKIKDLRESNSRISDDHSLLMTSSGISLSQIFVSQVIWIWKSVHRDVVGILVTSESSWSIVMPLENVNFEKRN